MVQSLGISVGNANSYVAAGQGGGIEILLNEYSQRSTPSMVAFTDQFRSTGVDASSNFFMNWKNTVYDLMVLLGRPYKDVAMQDANGRPSYSFELEEASDGGVAVVVNYLGDRKKFMITQILAMLFTKLRSISGNSSECVLSCPQFYNDQQKRELLQAALVAGLNPLQIISDMSAVALNYAYYRTTREDTHKFIAFVNLGQSNLQTIIAWLTPKDDIVRILSAESENVGGRDFDKCLAEHFISKHNLTLGTKPYLKMVSACEKIKRLLSANANEIPLHVESLISEEKDFSSRIDRATFEEMIQPLLKKLEGCLTRALANARTNFDKMMAETADAAHAAEVARAAEAQKAAELSQKAETAKAIKAVAVAKAAEQAKAANETKADNEAKDAGEEQSKGDDVVKQDGGPKETPSQSNKEVSMDAEQEELTRASAEEASAVQAAKAAKAAEKAMSSQANRLTKLSQLKFELQAVEVVGGSTRIPAVKQLIQSVLGLNPSTTLNTDEAVARGCVLHCATLHPGMKVKREIQLFNVESFTLPSGLTCDKDLRRTELELIQLDRKYKSRTEARNNLEEFIYLERSKLQDGDMYLQELSNTLDWLFSDEGEDAEEDAYDSKLADLKKIKETLNASNNNSQKEQPMDQQPTV